METFCHPYVSIKGKTFKLPVQTFGTSINILIYSQFAIYFVTDARRKTGIFLTSRLCKDLKKDCEEHQKLGVPF